MKQLDFELGTSDTNHQPTVLGMVGKRGNLRHICHCQQLLVQIMYLEDSKLLIPSAVSGSCASLLCLLGTSRSRAFPFLNPPFSSAAFACK